MSDSHDLQNWERVFYSKHDLDIDSSTPTESLSPELFPVMPDANDLSNFSLSSDPSSCAPSQDDITSKKLQAASISDDQVLGKFRNVIQGSFKSSQSSIIMNGVDVNNLKEHDATVFQILCALSGTTPFHSSNLPSISTMSHVICWEKLSPKVIVSSFPTEIQDFPFQLDMKRFISEQDFVKLSNLVFLYPNICYIINAIYQNFVLSAEITSELLNKSLYVQESEAVFHSMQSLSSDVLLSLQSYFESECEAGRLPHFLCIRELPSSGRRESTNSSSASSFSTAVSTLEHFVSFSNLLTFLEAVSDVVCRSTVDPAFVREVGETVDFNADEQLLLAPLRGILSLLAAAPSFPASESCISVFGPSVRAAAIAIKSQVQEIRVSASSILEYFLERKLQSSSNLSELAFDDVGVGLLRNWTHQWSEALSAAVDVVCALFPAPAPVHHSLVLDLLDLSRSSDSPPAETLRLPFSLLLHQISEAPSVLAASVFKSLLGVADAMAATGDEDLGNSSTKLQLPSTPSRSCATAALLVPFVAHFTRCVRAFALAQSPPSSQINYLFPQGEFKGYSRAPIPPELPISSAELLQLHSAVTDALASLVAERWVLRASERGSKDDECSLWLQSLQTVIKSSLRFGDNREDFEHVAVMHALRAPVEAAFQPLESLLAPSQPLFAHRSLFHPPQYPRGDLLNRSFEGSVSVVSEVLETGIGGPALLRLLGSTGLASLWRLCPLQGPWKLRNSAFPSDLVHVLARAAHLRDLCIAYSTASGNRSALPLHLNMLKESDLGALQPLDDNNSFTFSTSQWLPDALKAAGLVYTSNLEARIAHSEPKSTPIAREELVNSESNSPNFGKADYKLLENVLRPEPSVPHPLLTHPLVHARSTYESTSSKDKPLPRPVDLGPKEVSSVHRKELYNDLDKSEEEPSVLPVLGPGLQPLAGLPRSKWWSINAQVEVKKEVELSESPPESNNKAQVPLTVGALSTGSSKTVSFAMEIDAEAEEIERESGPDTESSIVDVDLAFSNLPAPPAVVLLENNPSSTTGSPQQEEAVEESPVSAINSAENSISSDGHRKFFFDHVLNPYVPPSCALRDALDHWLEEESYYTRESISNLFVFSSPSLGEVSPSVSGFAGVNRASAPSSVGRIGDYHKETEGVVLPFLRMLRTLFLFGNPFALRSFIEPLLEALSALSPSRQRLQRAISAPLAILRAGGSEGPHINALSPLSLNASASVAAETVSSLEALDATRLTANLRGCLSSIDGGALLKASELRISVDLSLPLTTADIYTADALEASFLDGISLSINTRVSSAVDLMYSMETKNVSLRNLLLPPTASSAYSVIFTYLLRIQLLLHRSKHTNADLRAASLRAQRTLCWFPSVGAESAEFFRELERRFSKALTVVTHCCTCLAGATLDSVLADAWSSLEQSVLRAEALTKSNRETTSGSSNSSEVMLEIVARAHSAFLQHALRSCFLTPTQSVVRHKILELITLILKFFNSAELFLSMYVESVDGVWGSLEALAESTGRLPVPAEKDPSREKSYFYNGRYERVLSIKLLLDQILKESDISNRFMRAHAAPLTRQMDLVATLSDSIARSVGEAVLAINSNQIASVDLSEVMLGSSIFSRLTKSLDFNGFYSNWKLV